MQWFEKEDFWNNFAPIMFDEARWAEAPTVAEFVCKIAGFQKLPDGKYVRGLGDKVGRSKNGLKMADSVASKTGRNFGENGSRSEIRVANSSPTVLDAGCGPGRISVELALLGCDVTGVDIIQSELDAAKETADDEGVKLNLINADLRTFESETKFDCAVNLYTSFGYCDRKEEDFEILKHICMALKDGGTFILENTSRETAILYFTEGEEFDRAGMHVTTHFSVVGAWEGLRSNWILEAPDGRKIEHEFVQRLYSAAELCEIMKRAGFSEANAYGDFDFSPYDQHARTMVIVAKK